MHRLVNLDGWPEGLPFSDPYCGSERGDVFKHVLWLPRASLHCPRGSLKQLARYLKCPAS